MRHTGARHPHGPSFGVIFAVIMAGCAADERTSAPAASPSTSPTPQPSMMVACQGTLAELCGGKCSDHDTNIEQLRRACTNAPMTEAVAGRCPDGAFSVMRLTGPLSDSSEYYDGDGKMIGVSITRAYAGFCNGQSSTIQAGVIPTCSRPLELERLCKS